MADNECEDRSSGGAGMRWLTCADENVFVLRVPSFSTVPSDWSVNYAGGVRNYQY